MPPCYLPTAMTCFAGFTYGNASEVRGPFISPPGREVEVEGSNSAPLCARLPRFSDP